MYATPLHRQPAFATYARSNHLLPVADDVCARHICLPDHSDMADEEFEQVIAGLGQALADWGDSPCW